MAIVITKEALKSYDSAFCGNLPLNNINLIQPHGYLFVLDRKTFEIVQLSENCVEIFKKPLEDILSTEFDQYIDKGLVNMVSIDQLERNLEIPLNFSLSDSGQKFLGLLRPKDHYLILEVQAMELNSPSFISVYHDLKYLLSRLEKAESVEELGELAVKNLQALSGFDRVMLYQFDQDWNGKVIAEYNKTGAQDYLGHQFPASDVPRQARAMYKTIPFRLIPTIYYTPVKLYPILNPLTMSFVDLSNCTLRSVAPVHLEFLKNMGVDASMSVRIVVNDELWGLISFHHNKALYPNYETCSSLELLSEYISRTLANILNKETFERRTQLNNRKNLIQQHLFESKDIEWSLFLDKTNILQLFRADGAFMTLGNQSFKIGNVPHEDDLQNLVFWLQSKEVEKVYTTDYLSGQFEEALKYADCASGLLAIELDLDQGNYLILFRPERPYTINWGGNPNEAIQFEPDKKTYHPRNSFQLWKQEVQYTSLPWHNDELNVATSLRNFLFEYLSKHVY